MAIETLKVVVNRQRLEHLYLIHEYMIGAYVPENNHEHLLHAHLTGMYWRLEDMVNQVQFKEGKQNKFKIKMTAADALAFCLLWGNEKFDMGMRGAVEIIDVIKQIDKEAKQPKVYGTN